MSSERAHRDPPLLRSQRVALLTEAIATANRVESIEGCHAVVAVPRSIRHRRHAMATVATLGLWAPCWAALSIFRREQRVMVAVEADGRIARYRL